MVFAEILTREIFEERAVGGAPNLFLHRNLPCEEYFTNTKKANKHTFGGSYCFLPYVRDIELLRSETIGFLRSAMEYATDLLALHFPFLHPSRMLKSTSIQKLFWSQSASWSGETTWMELATVQQKNIGNRLFYQQNLSALYWHYSVLSTRAHDPWVGFPARKDSWAKDRTLLQNKQGICLPTHVHEI